MRFRPLTGSLWEKLKELMDKAVVAYCFRPLTGSLWEKLLDLMKL